MLTASLGKREAACVHGPGERKEAGQRMEGKQTAVNLRFPIGVSPPPLALRSTCIVLHLRASVTPASLCMSCKQKAFNGRTSTWKQSRLTSSHKAVAKTHLGLPGKHERAQASLLSWLISQAGANRHPCVNSQGERKRQHLDFIRP